MARELSGAELVVDSLERLGVPLVYGLPGTQNVPLFEALRKSSIRAVVPTHEMAAGFMAAGGFRASGRVGVVTTIPGPGFTLALNALAEASHDSAGLLYLTLARPRENGRAYRLQEIDQAAMARPVVKEIFRVSHLSDLAGTVEEAFHLAGAGEPGPVMVEVESALLETLHPAPAQTARPPLIRATAPAPEATRAAADLVRSMPKVALYCGQGAQEADGPLRALAELLNAPVLTTLSGRGCLPESHPLSFHSDSFGELGETVPGILAEAELILVVGCKLTHTGTAGFRVELPREKMIRIDASPEVLASNYPARLAILGDARLTLQAILQALRAEGPQRQGWQPSRIAELRAELEAEKNRPLADEPKLRGGIGSFANFFRALQSGPKKDPIYVTDSGLHQMLARHYLRIQVPRGLIAPSDYQSMAFGLPAAIGAKLARPDRDVVALLGDGAFLMTAMELLTAVRAGIDLTVVVFQDGQYGLIRRQQHERYGYAHAVALPWLDLEGLARLMGATHFLVDGLDPGFFDLIFATPGVKLVELPIGDSLAQRATQIAGVTRATARSILGPSLLRRLKQLLGR